MMVIQEDLDLASVRSRVPECGHAGGKNRSLGKLQHCWESINLYPTGVGI